MDGYKDKEEVFYVNRVPYPGQHYPHLYSLGNYLNAFL